MKKVNLILLTMLIANVGTWTEAASADQDGASSEVKLITLPVTIGQFDRWDPGKEVLYVALDKNHKRLEEIELAKIKAVYLVQGNHSQLFREVFGRGGLGGVLGLSAQVGKEKVFPDKQTGGDQHLFSRETWVWTSVGASVGAVWGWLKARGVENVRLFPVYDLETQRADFHDQRRLNRILPGSFVQVVKRTGEELEGVPKK